MNSHVLIIDDDDRIRSLLSKYLYKNEFFVSSAESVESANKLINKYIFDLFIVDYMMQNENGIEFIQKIRKKDNSTPIIMLTALGEVENRIEGLSVGADDYLSKPFEPKELLLRINLLLKRSKKQIENKKITFGDFIFDTDKDELLINGNSIKLTDNEIKVLKIFLKNRNSILSRETLCNMCNEISERSIDVQITRLRKKIENDSKNPKFLKTIRNGGYIFMT